MIAFALAALLSTLQPQAAASPAELHLAPRLDLAAKPGAADPAFWAVVKRGKAVVPELLARLDDDTTYEPRTEVPMLGGPYAKGDVAFETLLQIVDVPWQELVPHKVKVKDVHASGFGAYYDYVRASRENRKQLANAVRAWYKAKGPRLVYTEMPDHPAGGFWAAPE